jgi:hypothetical protein
MFRGIPIVGRDLGDLASPGFREQYVNPVTSQVSTRSFLPRSRGTLILSQALRDIDVDRNLFNAGPYGNGNIIQRAVGPVCAHLAVKRITVTKKLRELIETSTSS